jgi:hypothetical protein
MRLLMRHCDTLQNGVDGTSKAMSCMDEADGHLSSPSTSMAVEQAAIVMVENAGTIKEDANELCIKYIGDYECQYGLIPLKSPTLNHYYMSNSKYNLGMLRLLEAT